MATRLIAAFVFIAIVLTAVYLNGIPLMVLAVLIALVCEYEIIKTVKTSGVRLVEYVIYAFTLLIFPAYYYGGLSWVFLLQTFAVVFVFLIGVAFDRYNFDSIFQSIFPLYYPQLFFVFIYMLILVPDKAMSLLMIMIMLAGAILTDTFALFTGKLLGRHKLCPLISPHKTVEGAIGGFIGGIFGTELMIFVLGKGVISFGWGLLLGALLSVFSQLGDLSASVIKRKFGVKDFGNLIPGHGGMMDRLDSVLFAAPVVYMFFSALGLHV